MPDPRDRATATYVVLSGALVLVAVAGYAGYVLYPRFDLPAAAGAALLALAGAAGVASFFSPCAFPLLVTLLARETGPGESGERRVAPLTAGVALAGGAAVFLALVGVGISLGGAALIGGVTFTSTAARAIRIVAGTVLVVLGLTQANVLPVTAFGRAEYHVHRALGGQARMRRERPVLAFGVYGSLYLLAGFG